MKTNRTAHLIRRIRFLVFGLAVIGMAVLGIELGQSPITQLGQTAARQAEIQQAPSINLDALMTVAH